METYGRVCRNLLGFLSSGKAARLTGFELETKFRHVSLHEGRSAFSLGECSPTKSYLMCPSSHSLLGGNSGFFLWCVEMRQNFMQYRFTL